MLTLKKYSKKLEKYFGVNKSVASKWSNDHFPEKVHEFVYKEGTSNIEELFKRY